MQFFNEKNDNEEIVRFGRFERLAFLISYYAQPCSCHRFTKSPHQSSDAALPNAVIFETGALHFLTVKKISTVDDYHTVAELFQSFRI